MAVAHRAVRDDLGDIAAATLWADALLEGHGVEAARRNAAGVCIEEVLTNLVRHARAEQGDKAIDIAVDFNGATVDVVISDACIPYDLTTVALPDRIGEKHIRDGGFGLRLIHGLATTLSYVRSGGRNALTLTFAPPDDRIDR